MDYAVIHDIIKTLYGTDRTEARLFIWDTTGREVERHMEFIILGGGLFIIIIAVIVAVVSSVVAAAAADGDDIDI